MEKGIEIASNIQETADILESALKGSQTNDFNSTEIDAMEKAIAILRSVRKVYCKEDKDEELPLESYPGPLPTLEGLHDLMQSKGYLFTSCYGKAGSTKAASICYMLQDASAINALYQPKGDK